MQKSSDRCAEEAFETDDLDELECGVWLTDADGRLKFASEWLFDVLGLGVDEARGTGWLDRVVRANRRTAKDWRKLFQSCTNWEDEVRLRDRAGRHRTLLVRAHAIAGDGSFPLCWVGLCLDISRRAANKSRELREARQRARLAERETIAREIHAGIQQLLYATKMHLVALKRSNTADEARERSETIRVLIDETIQVSRNLTRELKPPLEVGFGPALAWLAEWMSDKHGLELNLPDVTFDVAENTALIAFDVLRELAFNVVKHADVDSADVEVARVGDRLECAIADRGSGFEHGLEREMTTRTGSFGLADIRERLEAAGGTLSIASAPGKGTTIRFTLPAR